jgi:hypothetical protein
MPVHASEQAVAIIFRDGGVSPQLYGTKLLNTEHEYPNSETAAAPAWRRIVRAFGRFLLRF